MDGQQQGAWDSMTLEEKCKRIKKFFDAGFVVTRAAMRKARELAEAEGAPQSVKDDLAAKEQAVIDAGLAWCQSAKDAAQNVGGIVVASSPDDKKDQ